MKTRQEYISLILKNAEHIRDEFGVKSLRIFGSVARGTQTTKSDVDVCVEMAPKMTLVIGLQYFLENLLGCAVDLVRMHRNISPILLQEINRDGIVII